MIIQFLNKAVSSIKKYRVMMRVTQLLESRKLYSTSIRLKIS